MERAVKKLGLLGGLLALLLAVMVAVPQTAYAGDDYTGLQDYVDNGDGTIDVWLLWGDSIELSFDGGAAVTNKGEGFDDSWTTWDDGEFVRYVIGTVDGQSGTVTFVAKGAYEGTELGETSITIGSTTYNIHVYAPVRYVPLDVTDLNGEDGSAISGADAWIYITSGDNLALYPMSVDGYSYQSGYTFSVAHSGIGYFADYGYDGGFGPDFAYGDWGCDIPYYYIGLPYVQAEEETGDYTLDTGTGNIYAYLGVTDANGNAIANGAINGISYVSNGGSLSIDGTRVWCVDPLTGTAAGSKYNAEAVENNVAAAFATIYAGVIADDDLANSVVNAYIWRAIGYNVDLTQIKLISTSSGGTVTLSDLTAEQQQRIALYESLVNDATAAYEEGRSPDFVSETDGVTVDGGVITITADADGNIPTTIVLRAQNPEMLTYYSYGSISFSDGVTGVIDTSAGTLTLTVTKEAAEAGSIAATFSMVPADFPTESVLYTSQYSKQAVRTFGLADGSAISLELKVKPTTPEKPEEPTTPKTPSTPSTPTTTKTSNLPKTGDSNSYMVAIAVAIAGAVAAAIGIIVRRRGSDSK